MLAVAGAPGQALNEAWKDAAWRWVKTGLWTHTVLGLHPVTTCLCELGQVKVLNYFRPQFLYL